jgi:sugar lactone lactonase YvrE
VFTAQGNFSYSFGGAGTQDGKFSSTQGIAVDNDGKVYVSDNGRIQVFENQGEFSYKFSNDDFKRPRKIAFDNGKIYVADPDNHRIKIFTADGTLIDSIGYGSTDSEGNGSNNGTAPGSLDRPLGVDVDSNGLIYVADTNHSCIQVFTASGEYSYSISGVSGPYSVRVHNNKIYAVDSSYCIMIFDPPTPKTHTVSSGNVGIGTSSPTEKLEVDGNVKINNNLILANGASSVSQTILKAMSQSEARTITLPDTSGVVVVTDDGNITIPDGSVTTAKLADGSVTAAKLAGNPGNGTSGKVLVSNGDGTFDWADAGGAFTTQGSGSAILDYSFGSFGSETEQFKYPQDIAFDSNDNIYVADYNNNRIQVFTSSGDYSYSIGTGTNGQGSYDVSFPASIAIDSNDNVYVTGVNHIRVFTAQGNFSYSFGGAGSQDGKFSSPKGIAVDNDGKVYVADYENNRIQVFVNQGEFSSKFSDDFKRPQKLAFDNDGKIYVADPDNHRVKIFTADGTLVDSIGTGFTDQSGNSYYDGNGPGSLNMPAGVDVDSNGLIYVADTNHSRIQVFTASGEYSYSISGLSFPQSVRVHNNKIYVVDSSNCIMIFDPPTPITHTVSSGNVGIGTTSPSEALEVSGTVKINNVLRLEPMSSAPSNPSEGMLYYDSGAHTLKVYNGTDWQNCFE